MSNQRVEHKAYPPPLPRDVGQKSEDLRLKGEGSLSPAFVVLLVIIVVLMVVVTVRMKSQSKRINDYFCNAVRVYAFTGSRDARIAAVAAAKVAAGAQRNSMLAYLRGMASDLKQMSERQSELKPFADQFVEAAVELEEEISVKDWTINDIRVQKEELGNANSEYLNALNRCDPSVFVKKYPDFFK